MVNKCVCVCVCKFVCFFILADIFQCLMLLQFVYDKDMFSPDDKMGEAEFEITPFLEALRMHHEGLPSGTVIRKIQPTRQNCLSEESCIVWTEGKLVQNLFLRLKNVESGEVELQLQWIDIPGSRGI